MIFLIICITFIIVLIIALVKDLDEEYFTSPFWLAILFLCIGLMFTFNGATDYVSLRKDKIEIQTLINGIDDMKNARYSQSDKSKNSLINGSMENLKQSTNLSKYISVIMYKKAEYNSHLEKCKIYESEFIFNLLADGFFINEKVHELEPIK